MNFYDFEATDMSGNTISMSDYKGQVVLVVNTATKCGLAPQFEGLEDLHQSFGDIGLTVLGFPSNQFANQEPGSDAEVASACKLNFGVTFKLFKKIDVNGASTHPLFQFLKAETKGFMSDKIKWNFTKFLVDSKGNVIKRYAPTMKPEKIKSDIEKHLSIK